MFRTRGLWFSAELVVSLRIVVRNAEYYSFFAYTYVCYMPKEATSNIYIYIYIHMLNTCPSTPRRTKESKVKQDV
jgi:hypothetical protein